MIEINLLPGKKGKRGGGGAGFKLPDFKALMSHVKDPWLIGAVVAWALAALMFSAMWLPRKAQVHSLEPRLDSIKVVADQLKAVLKTKKDAEARQDTLRAQIAVIREIDRERYIWPHLLDAVSRALPPYTWLDEISTRPGEGGDSTSGGVAFMIHGKSADIQAITRFVRNLEESPYIQNATQVSTTVVTDHNRDVYDYVLNARYQVPDSTLLTMQPLAASLVQGYRSGSGRAPAQRPAPRARGR